MTAPSHDRRHGPENVIAMLRVFVVISMALLVAVGTPVHRTYVPQALSVVGIACVYAATVLLLHLQGRELRQQWITALDSLLTLAVIAATGGSQSLAVAVLPLAVVSTAVRQGLGRAVVAALLSGLVYALVVVTLPGPEALHGRLVAAAWWSSYLLAFALLAGSLRHLVDREHEEVVEARAEARADQLAYLEERDLRERLLEAQQARDDGVRVILHEFRTPVSSLDALTRVLVEETPSEDAQRRRVTTLVAAHARHLTQMLDQLAAIAATTGDPLGVSHLREVPLEHLAASALDAAGLHSPRGLWSVIPRQAVVRCDEQRVRRILTNLLENAAQHGGVDKPVELLLRVDPGRLYAEVLDRGPGLPPGQEHLVTRKYVSLGERRGTTGLGLWIVEQLVTAMDGTLVLAARKGGGLVARVELPLVD